MSFEEYTRFRRRILRELLGEFEPLLDESWRELMPMWDSDGRLEPLYTIREYPDKYVIIIDLPGADFSTLSVDLKGRLLIVRSRLKQSVVFANWGTVQREIVFREYSKTIELPEDIDPEVFEVDHKKSMVIITIGRKRS